MDHPPHEAADSEASAVRKLILPAFIPTYVLPRNEITHGNIATLHSQVIGGCEYSAISRRDHLVANFGQLAASTPEGFNNYPVILNGLGIPWLEANIYLLSRLFEADQDIARTLETLSADLTHFGKTLEAKNVNFKEFPKFRQSRPTYLYRKQIERSIELNEFSLTIGKRRMGTAIAFYRWLMSERLVQPSHAPWTERAANHSETDSHGFVKSRQVVTTDLTIRIKSGSDPHSDLINDAGNLRPLPEQEQEWLIDALAALGNTEGTLTHLIGIATGARTQTILTFRRRHVYQEIDPQVSEVRVPVGPGTGIDTKNNKRFVLFIPGWLYTKLCIYAHSDRYNRRLYRSKYRDDENAPLFLTNRGTPYYQAREETRTFNPNNDIRHTKIGQTSRQFIAERVIPYIRLKSGNSSFSYSLHDLRATFGMNETDHQMKLVNAGKITLHQAREHVKLKMAHESASITDRYLNYRANQAMVSHAQENYETHIARLMRLKT